LPLNIAAAFIAFVYVTESLLDRPMCIIANTIKGKGVSFMENKKEWHHATLSQDLYNQAIIEVKDDRVN
jgi:transketolase